MGERGPVPKHSSARVRRNKPPVETDEVPEGFTEAPYLPPVDDDGEYTWHPIAVEFYLSLQSSGQSRLYQDSDWMAAYTMCEALSRELKPQFVGMRQISATETRPVTMSVPLKGASLNALRAFQAALLVTEGDRRRLQVEIVKADAAAQAAGTPATPGGAKVLDMRRRFEQAGGATP